jgi:hypothetical protein
VFVSQRNVEPLTGIDPRRYLELLAAHPTIPRACVGKPRVVAVDDLRALLTDLAATEADDEPEPRADDDQPESADAILELVGVRRAG